jgi:hypothetical protein
MTDDPGLLALDLLYRQMMIDDEWSVRTARGFSWWAYRLAQHVQVSDPYTASDGAIACNMRIWTDIAAEVPDHDTKAAAVVGIANLMETMSALIWNNDDHTISECCTSVIYADTAESWTKVLTSAAVLQNTAAHSRAHGVSEALGCRLATSNHPKSGERPRMDDILNVPAQALAPAGAGPSKFAGHLMERVTGPDSPLSRLSVLTTGDANGLTAEFPYGGDRSAIELAANKLALPSKTALLQVMTDQPHPQLGSGALITLRLPFKIADGGKDGAADYANVLNFLEGTTDTRTTLLGAWCADPNAPESVAFVSFVPSALANQGVLENLCIYNAFRTQWAYGVMND